MSDAPFADIPRVDALRKVRGDALFSADDHRPGMVHAALAISTVGKGQLTALDAAAARALPGVRLVLTHEDLADLKAPGFLFAGGYGFQSLQVMTSPALAYRGQPIALVAADTLETAIEATRLVRASYAPEPFSPTMNGDGVEVIAQADSPLPKPMFADRVVGDADAAFDAAAVQIDATFTTPAQHQNPMELVACVAEWRDGGLVVHEGTQNAEGVRHGLALELGLEPAQVQVISPYVGGGFGQKNSLQMHTVLAAIAARRLDRPVKLVVPRAQVFHDTSFRPATRQRVRLGAERSGKLTALIHETQSQTSRHDLFPTMYTDLTARLHGIANFRGRESLVRTDVQTPGFMRGPWEHVSTFAVESCVDEAAYALGLDPVALRLANDTDTDPLTKLPLSSRRVADCLRQGAERFGWSRRSMAPGSMVADDGALIGWGVAIGAYPGSVVPEVVRLTVSDDGGVVIGLGGHEMGQGLRTVLAGLVGRKLGVDPRQVTAELGDTRIAPQHVTAGSWGTASAGPAAAEAADAMLQALAALAPGAAAGRAPAEILKAAGRTSLTVETQRRGPGQPDAIFGQLASGGLAIAGPIYPDFVTFSYIAHFVEVRVEADTRRVRVPRVVSVADCGRVMSPRTAESQVRGGVIWGLGAALREASEVDPRYGGFLNADLAEYVLPVNLDIGAIEVGFVDAPDLTFNSIGAKGLGEVAMVGVAPAVANAVHHATGRRLRDLPIRIEHLL